MSLADFLSLASIKTQTKSLPSSQIKRILPWGSYKIWQPYPSTRTQCNGGQTCRHWWVTAGLEYNVLPKSYHYPLKISKSYLSLLIGILIWFNDVIFNLYSFLGPIKAGLKHESLDIILKHMETAREISISCTRILYLENKNWIIRKRYQSSSAFTL